MVIENFEERNKKKDGVGIFVGNFHFKIFQEWDNSCRTIFGNCRWMKMWHDHLASKQLDVFGVLMEQIEELKFRLDKLEKKPKRDEIQTLGRKE